MIKKFIIIIFLCFLLNGCGKVGPLSLPEEKLNKSIITYPCDETCLTALEAEKERQQSVIIQTD